MLVSMMKYIPILQRIMQNCKNKIKWYNVNIGIYPAKQVVLSPLSLLNVKHITINDFYFYIIWSNKCQSLQLKCYK